MSNLRVIADIGSTHGNSRAYIKRAIDVCQDLGVELKFQLFKPETSPTNIALEFHLFEDALQSNKAGVFASVFDCQSLIRYKGTGLRKIKCAATMDKSLRDLILDDPWWDDVILSSNDYIDCVTKDYPFTTLYCVSEYPVLKQIAFDGIFDNGFDGFSDHTLGLTQTYAAIAAGAVVIEKHVKFEGFTSCPDAAFAITESQLKALVHG